MRTKVERCPIWNISDGLDAIYLPETREYRVRVSPRAGGGGYIIPEALVNSDIIFMTDPQKVRLTTWLIGRTLQGDSQPTITKQIIDSTKDKPALPVDERALRLLRFIDRSIDTVGQRLILWPEQLAPYAWSESTEWDEIAYCFEYLLSEGLVRGKIAWDNLDNCDVTVAGYRYIADQVAKVDSAQAFIAMWFNDSTDKVYEDGIKAGVKDAGFNPRRIDRKDHINKIEDEIIAEIRRSRFLVADFTHGEDGARGGVYYEAGFAHGLGLPVIFACKKEYEKTLHFDTAHFNHILWTEPSELRGALRNYLKSPVSRHARRLG